MKLISSLIVIPMKINKGLIKLFYVALGVLIVWLLVYHVCPKSKIKIEIFIGNMNFSFPFSGNNFRRKYLPVGEIIPNCGIEAPCPQNHIPVHLYTGGSVIDKPKICSGGKYVIHENIKNWIRGFNVVVVDPRRREAVAANGFDTGHKNTKELETFLTSEVREEDIIIVMTYDEASAKLTSRVKRHFASMGSGLIQNLQLKDQWYMISQKGIDGFSPYEELKPFRRGQFDILSRQLCVPTKIKGLTIIPDPPVQNNFKRERFCHKHPELEDFCSPSHILDELSPGAMIPKQSAYPFYHSPVVVLALNSLSSLSLTLETLLSQSGIQSQNVMVVYNPQQIKDVSQLCSLFGFKPLQTTSQEFWEILEVGLDAATKEFPKAFYVTVIEEGVLLSPDYSSFVAKVSQLLDDPLALGVSAWNPNGFSEVSSRDDLIYRVESVSWLAFTIKLNTYADFLKPRLHHCCNKRGWEGWTLTNQREKRFIIIPDVSRCFYFSNEKEDRNTSTSSLFTTLFHRERKTNLNPSTRVIEDMTFHHFANYDTYLHSILKSNRSRKINITKNQVLSFYEDGNLRLLFSYLSNKNRTLPIFVLPFIEAKPSTLEGTKMLCRCFGLFYHADSKPLGLYKGTLRFSINEVEFMLFSNLSPFFQTSPYNLTSLILP